MNDETFVLFGSEVKARGNDIVEGHLVLFSTKSDPDISAMKDFFTPDETDYDLEFTDKSRVYYQHGLDKTLGTKKLGVGDMKQDEICIWISGQLKQRDEYEKAVFKMAKEGKLGWSSGVPSHLVRREKQDNGAHKVLYWPLGLDASLTPSPAEPRTFANVKSLIIEGKSTGLSLDNKREILQRAITDKIKADTPERDYIYCYIEDVYDTSVVWRQEGRESGAYEADYTISGVEATIGQPQKVQRIVSYRALPEGTKSFSVQNFTERDCQRYLRDAGFPTAVAFKMSEHYKSLRLRDAEDVEDMAAIEAAKTAYLQTQAKLSLSLSAYGV